MNRKVGGWGAGKQNKKLMNSVAQGSFFSMMMIHYDMRRAQKDERMLWDTEELWSGK
jgi:hypothetical protein